MDQRSKKPRSKKQDEDQGARNREDRQEEQSRTPRKQPKSESEQPRRQDENQGARNREDRQEEQPRTPRKQQKSESEQPRRQDENQGARNREDRQEEQPRTPRKQQKSESEQPRRQDENQGARNREDRREEQPRTPRKQQKSESEQPRRKKKTGAGAKKPKRTLVNDMVNQNTEQTVGYTREKSISPPDAVPPPQPKRRSTMSGVQPLVSQVQPSLPPSKPAAQPKPKEASKLPIDPPPATLTGFKELKLGSAFLITLLWLPRFFIPWITAWHEFNIFISSNPYHWESRKGDLDKHWLYTFIGSSFIAIIPAIIYEAVREKFDLKYYLYMMLLILFTLSPVVGGIVDVLLRAGFFDSQLYTEWWLTSRVLMRWAMSFSFSMFPMQFACIYAQNNYMSRNAHYNWTSVFVTFEFLNSYLAFWVIPPKCPTREWVLIVVWVGIGILLITVVMMTLIVFIAVPALKYAMLGCINYRRKKERPEAVAIPEPNPFSTLPINLKMRKLMWCSMMLFPIVFSYFSFNVLEQFVPHEDWDTHHLWSATSMFFLGRVIGVVVMVLVMFGVRKGLRTYPNISMWRAEMFYMGVPHVFSILAFLTLVGRFATLSHLNEGDIILGPIPDNEKTVLLVFNTMYRNRTVCISSDHFRPVGIRPFHHVTRELYDIGVDSFTINVTVDPCSDSRLLTQFVVENFTKGDWVVFTMSIPQTNLTNEYVWDYYNRIYPVRLLDIEKLRPTAVPKIVIFTLRRYWPRDWWFHQLNHSGRAPTELMVANTYDRGTNASIEEFLEPRKPVIFDAPETGTWRVTTINIYSNATPQFSSNVREFEVGNFSLYYLMEYFYSEDVESSFPVWIPFVNPRRIRQDEEYNDSIPNVTSDADPEGYHLFKVGEIARPNSEELPSANELQWDWAIKVGLTLAGMAAGGLFHGLIYLFWLDPPIPAYRTTTLAVCWVLLGAAVEIKQVNIISVLVSVCLLTMHIALTALHFTGAYFMYAPELNSRKRAD